MSGHTAPAPGRAPATDPHHTGDRCHAAEQGRGRVGRWRTAGATSGPWSRRLAALMVALGLIWLTWPVWGSATAASPAQSADEAVWVLAAQLSLASLLMVTVVRETGGARCLAVALAASVTAIVARVSLTPATGGVEPVFWIPLLAGAVLGAPGGVLSATLACVVSSAAVGSWATFLPGQLVVWQVWGLAGAAMVRMRTIPTWLAGLVWSLVLGPVTGVLLNLIGWVGESPAANQAFLPGLGPVAQIERLWAWTRATSLAFDMSRALTNALVWLCLSPLLVPPLRTAFAPDRRPAQRSATVISSVDPDALRRRHIDSLSHSFDPPGDDHEH